MMRQLSKEEEDFLSSSGPVCPWVEQVHHQMMRQLLKKEQHSLFLSPFFVFAVPGMIACTTRELPPS
jgi:hypothetical protein